MAIIRGPQIVRSGLVLALDGADRNSYPGSGTTWKDISGNNNNATLISGPTFSSEKGGCIVFDGINNLAQISNSSSLNGNAQTINVWYNTTVIPARSASIISKTDATNSTNGYNILTGNSAQIKPATGGTSVGLGDGTSSIWYFTTLTFTINSAASFYVNGVFINTAALANFTMTSNVLRIGVSADSFWTKFTGKIAQINIYNRQLSATEILQNYNAAKSRFGL